MVQPALALIGLAAACAVAAAQPSGMDLPDGGPVATRHEMTHGGRNLAYTARAGFISLFDDFRQLKARIFYVSYTVDRVKGEKPRPLTFAWNGGPGSPASTLHLGLMGPRRAKTMDEYQSPPPPYQLVDNGDTWLAFTDLVFVDPVGTGYSFAAKPEYLKDFWNVPGDIDSIGEFIRLYQSRYDAADAPLYIAGESYGTLRAAGLAKILSDRRIALSGVILMSMGNLASLGTAGDEDLSAILLLPSLTASAFYHQKLAPDLQQDFQATLRQAESWAETAYAAALMKGDRLSGEERKSLLAQLARFTGLDPGMLDKAGLRITVDQFARQLLHDRNLELGHYDAHLTPRPANPSAPYDLWSDPSLVSNGTSGLIVPYLRSELGFVADARYAGPWGGGWPSPVSPRADWTSMRWDMGSTRTRTNPAQHLADAMRRNSTLRVFVAHGAYDLVTPYFGAEYAVSHMKLDGPLRRNIILQVYPGGHSMYTEKSVLQKMTRDAAEFYRTTTPARRPTPSVQQ